MNFPGKNERGVSLSPLDIETSPFIVLEEGIRTGKINRRLLLRFHIDFAQDYTATKILP